ncbi:MAG: cupredoxin domain-containing protein [Hyphomicrobiales bacterium]|nr:cupredoxin domain-containing protein [Hyphomicrobiales bacterium]MBV8826045.1 cupredoxin domain-containing protein [Hyphomicrobiales bacterium]
MMLRAFVLIAATALPFAATKGHAEDIPVFSIEFKDGVIIPLRLEVPAGRAFKIELHNTGSSPAEFESIELHREKVLAAQSTSFIVFRTLDPGEYKFFDDFHPGAPQAILVAK